MLDVSKDTICRWLDQGLLTGWRLPTGGRRVDIASVRRVAAEGTVPPKPHVQGVVAPESAGAL